MNGRNTTLRIARCAVVAALYIALGLAGAPLSFLAVQFRFAEILILLCFYNKDYCVSLTVGCAVVNAFSPFGIYDVLFGTFATILTAACVYFSRRLFVATLFPTFFCFIVALELYLIGGLPFWITCATVMAGEFTVVTLIGYPVFRLLARAPQFAKIIGAEEKRLRKRPPAA